MARLDDISDAAREKIVRQAAPLLHNLDSIGLGAPAQKLILGPSLREEMLSLDAVQGGTGALQPTGQTLSILHAPSDHPTLGAGPGQPPAPVGYVRAGPTTVPGLGGAAGEDWSVTLVSSSDLSARIQAAIDWIAHNVEGDPLIRVLTVPAYHVTALSLYRDNTLIGVVVVTPPQGKTLLQKEKVYSSEEFRRLLREQPPAQGLTLK